jgi:hypothetical protein
MFGLSKEFNLDSPNMDYWAWHVGPGRRFNYAVGIDGMGAM